MSRKPLISTRKTDRRIRRTREALSDALITLMREKPFDAITIQDVLDLAGVSRSTFYTHFRDKDDLFLSNADDSFHHLANVLILRAEESRRVAPVREFFAHAASLGEFHDKLVATGKHQDAMELAREHFARGIERRLAKLAPEPANASASRSAIAHMLTGAMFSLVSWWLNSDKPASPAQMDDIFHQMVWAGISGAH